MPDIPFDHAENPKLVKISSPRQKPCFCHVNPNRMEHTASPTAHIRIANTFFLMEITSTFVRVFIISIAEICEQIYIISACRRCCSLWQTAAPILAVPRCMGRSDGKRNVLSQCQTPCSPFPGLRRSAGRSPDNGGCMQADAFSRRCCGCGYG